MRNRKTTLQLLRAVVLLTAASLLLDPARATVRGQEELASSYYHFSLAKMHDRQQRFAEAISEFEKALQIDPTSARLHFEFASTLVRAGNVKRSIEECQKSIELDPEDPDPHFLMGQIYQRWFERGDKEMLPKAIDSLKRTVELDPKHVEALFYLGQLYFYGGNPEESARVLGQFTDLRADYPPGFFNRARALVEIGKVEEAIEVLESSLQVGPPDPDNLQMLEQLYEQTGQPEKAVQRYREALEIDSGPELGFRAGRYLSAQGHFKEAAEVFERLLGIEPDNVLFQTELGKALEGIHHYRRAAEVLGKVIETQPDSVEANYYLASSLRALGKRDQAIERIEHLLSLARQSPEHAAYRMRFKSFLAILYQEDRQYQEAVAQFREILREEPGDSRARLGLVYALQDAGELKEADTLSRKMLEDVPGDLEYADVLITRARVLSLSDRLEEAIQLLKKNGEKAGPEDVYLTAGQLYAERKRYVDAEKVVREGLRKEPDSDRLRFQLGSMLERQGKLSAAEKEFLLLLEEEPREAPVLNYLGYMLAENGLRLQQALDYVLIAVEEEPDNGAYLDSLGWVYFQLGRFDEAKTYLLQAEELTAGDPTILEHLGDLYRKLGDYGKARTYYERSVSTAEDPEERRKVEDKLVSLSELLSERRE